MKLSRTGTSALALGIVLATAAGGLGCAAKTPPPQLTDARTAYQRATTVPGAAMAASDLYEARQALDAAEQAFGKEGPKSNRTKNLAYIAHRKAIAAMGRAETMEAQEQKRLALLELQRFRDTQIAARQRELDRQKGLLSRAQEQAEAERQARVAAEAKVRDMLGHIEGIKTTESERGLVVTLSDGVLFTAGKSQLTAEAKKRLAEIAAALRDDQRNLVVLGHTDAQGRRDANLALSQARANAVRLELIAAGIDDKRIRAEGLGETRPIADNKTREGRAANRRVEIILERAPEPEPAAPPLPENGGPPPSDVRLPRATPPDAPPAAGP